MNIRTARHALPFAALLLLAGCGGKDEDAAAYEAEVAAGSEATMERDAAAAAAAAAEAAAVVAAESESATRLDVAAIDAVVSGIRKENELLASVAERMPEAKDDMAKLELMGEVQPARLEEAGAAEAGMEANDYRLLKDQLFTVIGTAEMRTMLEAQLAAQDTTGMDAAMAEQARAAAETMKSQLPEPYEGLDAETADAIKARLPELTELRGTHIGLLFKAAGG